MEDAQVGGPVSDKDVLMVMISPKVRLGIWRNLMPRFTMQQVRSPCADADQR